MSFILLSSVLCLAEPVRQSTLNVLPVPDLQAYQAGEKLTFLMHYGAINAGEATMTISPTLESVAGKPHYHVVIKGYTNRTFDAVYKVRDHYESYIETETLLPSMHIRDVLEDKFTKKETYLFNQATHKVKSGNKVFDVEAQMHDLVSSFYYLRCVDFSQKKPGAYIPINIFFEEETLSLGLTYSGIETIKTRLGRFSCYKFKPKLATGRVFKDQSDMTLYVTADKNQLPIRIESAVLVGHIRADLISFSGLKYPLSAKK